jgi:hypothetical protein
MANISKAKRRRIETAIFSELQLQTGDELSYAILVLSLKMLAAGNTHHDVIGGIASANAEIFRKVIGPAEAQREHDNGSISE